MRDRCEDGRLTFFSRNRAFKGVNGNRMKADGGVRLEWMLSSPSPATDGEPTR